MPHVVDVVVGQNLHINVHRNSVRLIEIRIVPRSEGKYRARTSCNRRACGYLCLGGVVVVVMMARRRQEGGGGVVGATSEEEVLVPTGGIAGRGGGQVEEQDEDVGQVHI